MEPYDVVEDIVSCLRAGLISLPVDALSFQQTENPLSCSVVGATSHPAHAVSKLMSFQEALVFVSRKWTAAIRVQHDWASIRALPQCNQDGWEYELWTSPSFVDV